MVRRAYKSSIGQDIKSGCAKFVLAFVLVLCGLFALGYFGQALEGWTKSGFVRSILLGLAASYTAWKVYHWIPRIGQRRRDEYAQAVFAEVHSGKVPFFCIFLRPFYITGKITTTRTFYIGSTWSKTTYELEAQIIAALRKYIPTLALGAPGKEAGVGRILANEADWQRAVSDLIDRATLILCVPSAHPGTKWELDSIVNRGHLKKTVFLMPPVSAWNFILNKKLRKDWQDVWDYMHLNGIPFPPYESSGLLFSVHTNAIWQREELFLDNAEAIKDAIATLSLIDFDAPRPLAQQIRDPKNSKAA